MTNNYPTINTVVGIFKLKIVVVIWKSEQDRKGLIFIPKIKKSERKIKK